MLVATGAQAGVLFQQDFESDTDGWFDENNGWAGTVNREASGTGGVNSAGGSYHASFNESSTQASGGTTGPFSSFDGYRDTWPGEWTSSLDIYLDPSWDLGAGFDYSVAASGTDGNHQRDFIFHTTKDTSTGNLLVGGSNNSNFAPREDLENLNFYEVDSSGWYTYQHRFYDDGGSLSVDLNLLDSSGSVLFTETRSNATDLIPGEVGGNRYAWFTHISVADGINVDNQQLSTVSVSTVPEPGSMLAFAGLGLGLGFVRRRRSGSRR
jgi:hypothetical protein